MPWDRDSNSHTCFKFSEVIIANDLTDSNGEASDSRTYAADQTIEGYAVKGGNPPYKGQSIADEMPSDADKTIVVSMIED